MTVELILELTGLNRLGGQGLVWAMALGLVLCVRSIAPIDPQRTLVSASAEASSVQLNSELIVVSALHTLVSALHTLVSTLYIKHLLA